MRVSGQTFIANLGDQGDPVEHGGLFLYRDADGSHSLEKLEEPCDDDHCEECEDEPDLDASDAIWDINREEREAFSAWCEESDRRGDPFDQVIFDATRREIAARFAPAKGRLAPHLGPGGQRCVGFDPDPGSGEDFDTRTPPKPVKQITNKRPGKSKTGGAARR